MGGIGKYVIAKLDEIAKLNPDQYVMRLNVEGKPFVTLGAATVGQAVRCTFMNNQGGTVDVIVKILRPGVKERFEEDVKIFDAVAFKNAEKDDVNHQHDGHTKVRTNKL